MSVQTGPNKSPLYATHREAVAAVDVIANVGRGKGINMANYKYAHIQVIPTLASGANPTVTVYWWSEAAGKFVQEHTTIAKTGVGANVPYEFTVECLGRIMFVAITTMVAGSVDFVMVSGFELLNAG